MGIKNMVDVSEEPFDIRTAPVWAVPQLAFLMRRLNSAPDHAEMVDFRWIPAKKNDKRKDVPGYGTVYIDGEGFYTFTIYKSKMNNPVMPTLKNIYAPSL